MTRATWDFIKPALNIIMWLLFPYPVKSVSAKRETNVRKVFPMYEQTLISLENVILGAFTVRVDSFSRTKHSEIYLLRFYRR